MSPGGTLVPYAGAGTPAVDDAGTTRRTMATGPTSVRGVSGANAGNDGKKSRDQKGFHTAVLRLGGTQRPTEAGGSAKRRALQVASYARKAENPAARTRGA